MSSFNGATFFFALNESEVIHRLAPVGMIFAILCYLRREQAIGGWLMFFYYQIYGSIFLMILSVVSSAEKYMPSYWEDWGSYLVFLLAFLPRLGAFILVGYVATIMLRHRDWFWVRNLMLTLYAAMIFTLLSVVVDLLFFPSATLYNTLRLAMLGIWLGYFYASERVKRVFLQKSWS